MAARCRPLSRALGWRGGGGPLGTFPPRRSPRAQRTAGHLAAAPLWSPAPVALGGSGSGDRDREPRAAAAQSWETGPRPRSGEQAEKGLREAWEARSRGRNPRDLPPLLHSHPLPDAASKLDVYGAESGFPGAQGEMGQRRSGKLLLGVPLPWPGAWRAGCPRFWPVLRGLSGGGQAAAWARAAQEVPKGKGPGGPFGAGDLFLSNWKALPNVSARTSPTFLPLRCPF